MDKVLALPKRQALIAMAAGMRTRGGAPLDI
jgi:hypothetical protein